MRYMVIWPNNHKNSSMWFSFTICIRLCTLGRMTLFFFVIIRNNGACSNFVLVSQFNTYLTIRSLSRKSARKRARPISIADLVRAPYTLAGLVSSQVWLNRAKNSVKEIPDSKSPQALRRPGIIKLAGDSSSTSSVGESRILILFVWKVEWIIRNSHRMISSLLYYHFYGNIAIW